LIGLFGRVLPAHASGPVHLHLLFILKKVIVKLLYSLFLSGIVLWGCDNQGDNTVNVTSLLKEMLNREAQTRLPSPKYKLIQVSSWDRTQTDPKNASTWFANKDYNYCIREEKINSRTEYVIMDAKGPGAITRWWLPQEQMLKYRVVRIYLDGNPTPVLEDNYQDFMNGSSFIKWPFAFTSSDEKDAKFQYNLPVGHHKQVGAGMYFPIPFAKSCKVTLDVMPFYYVINYRQYEENTDVLSFTKEDFKLNEELISTIGEELLEMDQPSPESVERSGRLDPDGFLEVELPSVAGKAISGIRLNIHSKENKQANRGVVLQIQFDNELTVWSPVSEFFGGGVYGRPAQNNNVSVDEGGMMNSHWLMPYKKSAKLTLKNHSSEVIQADINVSLIDYVWNDKSMYFHADWHEEAPLNTPPFKDWNYIDVSGKGIYAGDVLTIHSSVKPWWGEGDEKIYIDGEVFPSQLGTGLEDYYGYAWGMANYFSSPFISMPERDARGKDDWRGYHSVSRIRLLDAIPFETQIKVDIEAWQVESGVSYSVTTFWYGIPGATDNIQPDEQTIKRKLPDFIPIAKVQIPGTPFPDPAIDGLIVPKGNGTIRQAGNHLDLLAWKDPNVKKSLDADGDNRFGTAGFHLIGLKRFSVKEMAFNKDSLQSLPEFVESLIVDKVVPNKSLKNAWLFIPEDTSVSYITGIVEAKGTEASNALISFVVNKKVPSSFRLGIMLDNEDEFNKVGKYLIVKNLRGGNSGEIPLARSNRVPDWYFFDIHELKPGDRITIQGKTEKKSDFFAIGGFTFDLMK